MDDALTGTSSFDAAARTEPQDGWRKSSYSGDGGGGNCVEVRLAEVAVLIRDSKYLRDPANDPAAQPIISLAGPEWDAFLSAIDAGRFG
ncbi:DUF397 domain-containing protein [Nocardia inohanensis]|uniref:DUF397 domain-containing protein n=1 Tax=Nocardia inohanensis TaxID=209246 RepID=UPI00083258DC|nr:DUF397 domain-containing protein [Nocardia inohanensis]